MESSHEKLWELLEKYRTDESHSLLENFIRHLEFTSGRYKFNVTGPDIYHAIVLTLRDVLIKRKNLQEEYYHSHRVKKVYYISIEFLLGNLLNITLVNLKLRDQFQELLSQLGYDLDDIIKYEPDAGLGNGGLGRLAACFLDSMAALNLPCVGSGLRYDFGMFHQQILDGHQRELPDNWLARGNPWELKQNDLYYPVHFYGTTKHDNGKVQWAPEETVFARAHDIFISGYGLNSISSLRLWQADSSTDFKMDYFHYGNYLKAIEDSVKSSYITKVLYPSENVRQGKELRLKQEYFLVSATIQDALRNLSEDEIRNLPDYVNFHLNDTHPALAIAELMHVLVDVYDLEWEHAWRLTTESMAYTNHTVMPEALETWSVELLDRLLPRHLEIIYAVNYDFLEELKKSGFTTEQLKTLSIVEEHVPKKIRMANLAIVGSKSVNGVSAMHTDILKNSLFKEFYGLFPEKFQNKTNGINFRRWLYSGNPELAKVITRWIGETWIDNLDEISNLEKFVNDPTFIDEWAAVKLENKRVLAGIIRFECGIEVDPHSIFDIHVKRIHEYKRQLLNVLRIIGDYLKLKNNRLQDYTPRTFIFAGKAAPDYHMAKLIIKLINSLGNVINRDSAVNEFMKVVFLPDFRVSLAEKIYPAADISEQISTAGTEASGTGNMKFTLNGAPVVGTLDGANIEILENVGAENIYIFGNTAAELEQLRNDGYDPVRIYNEDPEIHEILNSLNNGFLNGSLPHIFNDIFYALTGGKDHYFLLADYHHYVKIQNRVSLDFRNRRTWTQKSILNSARSNNFSSDRTIREYARDIWNISPLNPDQR